jgi:lipid A disaccharide synthetase
MPFVVDMLPHLISLSNEKDQIVQEIHESQPNMRMHIDGKDTYNLI